MEHLLPVVEHKFPIEVIIGSEVKTFNAPEDVPEGVHLKLYEAPKKEPKIINTGVPNVWSPSLVSAP